MTFKPGQSGNPGGRPKGEKEVIDLARQHGPAAVKRLVDLINSDDERVSIAAASAVLDRGFGKPTQPLAGDPDRPPVGAGVDLSTLSPDQLKALATVRLPTDR